MYTLHMYQHPHVCKYIHKHVNTYKRPHLCFYVYIYTHMYVYIYIHTPTYVHIDVHRCISKCMCMYINMYLVGGFNPSEISVCWDYYSIYMEKHVPNHQPGIYVQM